MRLSPTFIIPFLAPLRATQHSPLNRLASTLPTSVTAAVQVKLRYFHYSRPAMSGPSKTKNDTEWRAILSPEQVGPPRLDQYDLRLTRAVVPHSPTEGH